jgi:hypothetical protein
MVDIAGERARLRGQGLHMTLREQWGARQSYTSDRRVNRPASWLFLHISVTGDPADTPGAEAAACRTVESIGQQRFGIGCSYNAGVMQSGRLYEMQPLTRRGAHTVNDLVNPNLPRGSLNYSARALVLVQNVQDAVTDAQIHAAARWGAALCRSGEAVRGARWYGHRDVTRKSCPGDKGYARLAELNRLTRHYEAHGLGATQEEDDMDLNETLAAMGDGQPLAERHQRQADQGAGQAIARQAAEDGSALRKALREISGQEAVTATDNVLRMHAADTNSPLRTAVQAEVAEALTPVTAALDALREAVEDLSS